MDRHKLEEARVRRPKCPNRRSYDSLDKARVAAEIASRRGVGLVAYICPRCGWAHLGPTGRPR